MTRRPSPSARSPASGPDPASPGLAPPLPIGRADTALGKADAATGWNRTKALEKVRAQLAAIDKKTTKAAIRRKIDDACRPTILAETGRIRTAFADVS